VDRLIPLIKGDFSRLNKYNLFAANFVVMLVWATLVWFIDAGQLKQFVPVIFVADSTMMTILLVGATLFYEKQEHTVNSVMVSPVTEDEYLMAKIIVSVLNSLITVVIISGILYFVKDVSYNYLLIALAAVIVTTVHTLIGIFLSYHAKNFTAVLINLMVYSFVCLFPTLFASFGLINAKVAKYLIVLPPEAANILFGAGIKETELWKLVFGFVYLIALAFVLYRFIVKPKFNDYVMREMGV
jgi:fluoroquinolone transport system permease protein